MKKLSLVIVLVLALAASFAQTFTEDFETWTVLTGSYTTAELSQIKPITSPGAMENPEKKENFP